MKDYVSNKYYNTKRKHKLNIKLKVLIFIAFLLFLNPFTFKTLVHGVSDVHAQTADTTPTTGTPYSDSSTGTSSTSEVADTTLSQGQPYTNDTSTSQGSNAEGDSIADTTPTSGTPYSDNSSSNFSGTGNVADTTPTSGTPYSGETSAQSSQSVPVADTTPTTGTPYSVSPQQVQVADTTPTSGTPYTSTPSHVQAQPAPAAPKATITYKGGMCNGNDAWWVNKWSDGHIDWIKNYGHQPNECGNTTPQPTNPPATNVTASQPAVSTHNGTSYPQCGGTVGLEGFPSNHTIIVTPVLDSNGNVVRYDHEDKNVQAGQCGNPQATTAQAAPAPVTTTTTQTVSTANCNDDVTYYDPSVGQYIHKHGGRPYNPASAYETQAKDANGCIYAFDQVSAPLVTTCKGQISEDDLESQLHGANYPGPFGLQYQSAEVQAYNNAACPVATPTPTSAPVVTNVTCPANTTATMNGNTVVCVSNTPAVTSGPISSTTRQLPETGVPLAGVSLAGLVPLGLRLRRFNKLSEKSSGQSIWKDREFKSVLK